MRFGRNLSASSYDTGALSLPNGKAVNFMTWLAVLAYVSLMDRLVLTLSGKLGKMPPQS